MANTGSPGMVLFAYISFALGGVLVVGGCIYMIIWAFCNKCLPCGRRSGAKADGRQVGHAKYMDKNLSGRGNASAQEGDTESLNYEGHTFLPRDATTGQDKDHKQTRAQVEETNRRSNGAVISVHEENELGMVRRESSKNKDDKKRQGMVIGTAAAATTTAVVAGATTIIISEHKDNADEGRNEGGGGEDAIRTDNDRGLYDDQLDTNSNTNLVQNEDTHTFMSAAVIDESMGDGDRTMNEHPESSQYIEDNMGREEYMAQPSSQQQVAEVEEHIEPVEAISNKRLQTFYDDYTQEGSSTVIGAQEQEDWRRQGMGTQSEEFDEVSAGRATQIELRQSEDEVSTFKGISHDNWQEDIVHVTPDADRNEVDNNLEVEKDQTPLLQESFGVEEVSYHQDSVVDVGRKGSIDEMVQRNSQGEPFFSDLTDSMQKNYEIDDEVTYNSNNHDMSVIEREESFHVQQSNYPIDLSNPDVQEEVMNNDERLLQQLQDIDRQDSAQSTGGGITTIQTNLGEGSGVESPEVVNEQSIHSVANERESDEDRGMSLAAVGVTGASLAGDKILRKKKKRSSLFSKEHKGEDNQDVEMTNLPPQDIDSPDEDDARGGGKRKSKKEKEKEEKLKKKEKQKGEELQRKLDKEQERERKKLLEREKKESKKLNKKQKASESTQIITAGVPLIATSRNEDNAEVEMENFSEERFGASHLEEEEQRCTNEGHVVEAAAIPILETAKENQKKDRTKQEKEQEDKERRKEKEHLERESKKEKERQKKERELQIKREKEEEKLKKKQQEQEEKERRKMSKKKQAEDVKEDDKQDHDHEQVETSREEVKGEKEGRKQKEKEEKERKKELEREEGESKKERERQQKEDELKQKRMKEEEKMRRKQQEKEERADRKKSKIEKEEMGEKQYEQDHEVTAAAAPIVAAVKESKKDKRNKRESKKINKESVETSQGEDEEHHLAPTAAVPIVQQEEDTERIEEKRGKEGKKEKEKEEKERKKELERQERKSKKERERQRKEEESQRKREKEEEKMRKKQLEREERESKKKKKIEKDEAEELQHEQDHGVMAAAVPIIQPEEETERAEEKGEKEGKKEKEKEERARKKELERQERESKKERERQRKEEESQRKREKEEEKMRKKQLEREERESKKKKKIEKDEAEELQHEQDHGVMAAAVPIIQQEEETERAEEKGEKEGKKEKEKEERERKKELERQERESKKERERQRKEEESQRKREKEEEKMRKKQLEREERESKKKKKIEKDEAEELQHEQDHGIMAAAVPIIQQEEETERAEEKGEKEGKKEKEKEERERKKELERQERESKKERERQRKEEELQRKRKKEEEKMRKKQLEREERESKKKKKTEKDEAEELQHEQDHGIMAAAVPIVQQEEETERAEGKGEKEGKKVKEKEERERKKELERQERESKKERERQRKEEELQRKREKEEEKLRKKQKEHEERESRKMKKKEKGAMKTEMEGARTDEEEQTVSYGDEFLAGAKDSKKYKNSKKKEKDSKRKKRDDNRGSEEEQLEGTEHKAEDSPDLRRQLNDDLVESSESKKEKKSWLGFQKPKHSSGTEEDSSNVLYAAAPIAGTAAVGAVAAAVVTGTYDKTGGHQPDVGTLGEAPGSAWQENNLMTDDDHEDYTTVINKNLLPAEGDSDSLLIADSPGPRARSSPILYEEDEYQDSSFGATGGMAIKKELAVKDDEGYQTHDQDGDSSAHDIQFDRDSSGEQRPLIVNDDFDDTRHQHMEELGKPGVDMDQTNVNQGYEYINNDERQEEEHFQDMDDQRKSGPDMTQTKVNQGYEYINNDEGQEEEHFEDMEDQRKSGPDMTQTNVNQGYEYINYDERQKEEHFEDMEDKRKSGPDMTQTYENQGHEYSDEIRGEANHEDTKYDRQPYTDTADQHRETEVYSQHDNSEVEREHISDVRASTSGPSDWEEAAESQLSTGRTEQTSLTSTQREAWDSQNVQRETAGSMMAVAPSFTDEIQASSRNNDDDEDMPISKSILADIRQKRNLKTPIRSDSIETNEDKDGTLFDELHTVLRSKKKDERESAEIVYDVDDTKYTGNGKAANEHLTEEYDISKFNVRARASLFEKITESTGEKVIPSFGGVTATHSYIRPLSPTVMRLTEGASDKSGISDTTEHRDIITDAESDQVEYHYKPSRDSLATTDRMTPSVDEQSEYQHKPARDSLVSQDLQSYHADERREQDNESPTNGHFHTFDRNEDSFDEPVDAIRHSAEETDSAVQYQDLETLTNYHLTNGDYITNGHSENAFDRDDGHHSFSEEPPEAQDLDKSMTNIKVKELNRMSVHDNFNSEVDASMVF